MYSLPFDYILRKSSRAHNLRISINRNAEVIVTKPHFLPMFMVDKFLKANEAWVVSNLEKAKRRVKAQLEEKNALWYLGKKYTYSFKKGHFNIVFNKTKVTVYTYSEAAAKRSLKTQLKKEAKYSIVEAVKRYSSIMALPYNSISIKDQSTRWGSCSSKKNLNFSWRLIMTPPQVLEYVVIHELAHLKHLNHSKNFWLFVEKYDPEYREHRRWLKRHETQLSNTKSIL